MWSVLLFYCAWQFFNAVTFEREILWAGAGLVCVLIILAMKLWYFMELNRRAFIHEIKRLELQVSLLAEKLDGHLDGNR